MLVALALSGVFDGIGLTALFPMLELAQDPQAAGKMPEWLAAIMDGLGLAPTIGNLMLLFAGGMWLKAVLLMVANTQVGFTVARAATDLRLELLHALTEARWSYFHRQATGALANAVATEAMRASEAYLQGARMIAWFMQALVAGGVAIYVSWRVALVAIAGGALVLAMLNWLVRITRRAGLRQTELQRQLLAGLTDLLHSVKPLKAMAREHQGDQVLQNQTRDLNRTLQKQVLSKEALRSGQEPLLVTLGMFGLYFAVVREGLLVAPLTFLLLILVRALLHLNKTQRQYQEMAGSESAYFAIRAAIDEARHAQEAHHGTAPPVFEREIRLQKVTVNYDRERVLQDIDLVIPAGRITTLTGPSGSGKTTIVDLIAGLVTPESGRVLIDDRPLAELDIRTWRRRLGYVPQETVLLHDTVRHNITLGDPALGRAEVEAALRAAEAWDFVSDLPHGMETPVGERGGLLSGGQRQRIVIARALVHRPLLLILDEATSALDPLSETGIGRTLLRLRGELTILAVSHRPALIEIADQVYRVENGSVYPAATPT